MAPPTGGLLSDAPPTGAPSHVRVVVETSDVAEHRPAATDVRMKKVPVKEVPATAQALRAGTLPARILDLRGPSPSGLQGSRSSGVNL